MRVCGHNPRKRVHPQDAAPAALPIFKQAGSADYWDHGSTLASTKTFLPKHLNCRDLPPPSPPARLSLQGCLVRSRASTSYYYSVKASIGNYSMVPIMYLDAQVHVLSRTSYPVCVDNTISMFTDPRLSAL